MPGGNPKDEGRSGGNPKDEGRSGGNPKDEGRGLGGTFGGGAGWAVVAFFSPVGMSVPDLAVRMLQGESSPVTSEDVLLTEAAADAQEISRTHNQDTGEVRLRVDDILALLPEVQRSKYLKAAGAATNGAKNKRPRGKKKPKRKKH